MRAPFITNDRVNVKTLRVAMNSMCHFAHQGAGRDRSHLDGNRAACGAGVMLARAGSTQGKRCARAMGRPGTGELIDQTKSRKLHYLNYAYIYIY